MNKFNSLTRKPCDYFNKPITWKLSLYDHLGCKIDFYYHIENSILSPCNEQLSSIQSVQSVQSIQSIQSFQWQTEIPISRLYGALNKGYALNFLYLRINDLNPKVLTSEEKMLENADLIDDPLLRVLYENQFATYQKAQLKEINNTSSMLQRY